MRRSSWWNYVACFLSEFRWFRRLYGGHWERWWIDACNAALWLPVERCTRDKDRADEGIRPPCAFGRPSCEDHG